MSDEEITLRIANVDVRVPLYADYATTEAIAAAIDARVREIEANTKGRLDSTAFALRAAFEFASDLHALREEQEATVHGLKKTLEKLLTRLESAAEAMESQA